MRRITALLGVMLALSMILVACSGSDDAAMTTAAAYDEAGYGDNTPDTTMVTDEQRDAMNADAGEAAAEGGTATDAAPAPTAINPADLGRLIVYTAAVSVEVDDVITAGAEAQAAVAGLGGILFGQETTTGEHPRSILTIKVPPENFHLALERLSGVGELVSQSVYADDVTERVVDLQSQITTAEASVERLRTFLEGATDLEAVAAMEAQLLARETELELLRGRLRTLEDQVALATIVLTLTEPVPPEPEPSFEVVETGYAGHDGGAGCPGAEDLRIGEGEAYTVCIAFTNTGDTDLADIAVRDPGLRADEDDFVLVSGSLDDPLPPDGTLVFAWEGDGNIRWDITDPSARATAVDDDGDPLRVGVASTGQRLYLTVDPDDSLPGFVDAMEKAWHALQQLFGVIVVIAGAAVPWLWAPILLGLFVWWRRRRDAAAAASHQDAATLDVDIDPPAES